jgi:hypothetical protein
MVNPLRKEMKNYGGYRRGDLRNYNWRPGFEQIRDEGQAGWG